MRSCWEEERSSFAGEFFRFDALGAFPKPAAGAIPIWIGGHTLRAFRRIAELGDGWHAAFTVGDAMTAALGHLREACGKAGREFASVALSARIGLPAKRPAAEMVAELGALRDVGVTHVVLESRVRDLADMSSMYERFASEVLPRL
jgi:alkanesulfonate monooxygenase SsuD/methylene tetrahydromethanopterin reductase-like flavin-dependent oxidoreductase (luciferase family)